MNNKPFGGSYQLMISVNKSVDISVGALGLCRFDKGEYVYTGSAMKNLKNRIERHIRLNKTKNKDKLHWHIDYLLTCSNATIFSVKTFPSYQREECIKNKLLIDRKDTIIPVWGFGSSDCKTCKAHLVKIG